MRSNLFLRNIITVTLTTACACYSRSMSMKTLSVVSWNINGLRSLLKHDKECKILRNMIQSKKPDFICLQETKLQEHHVSEMETYLIGVLGSDYPHIRFHWSCSRARKGYSGTAIISLGMDKDYEVR